MKHIVSFSGGKDSTAMLLMMIEKGMQIDEIIFCDTTKEFPQMYKHIDKVEKYTDCPITKLQNKTFDYWMFNHVKTKGGSKSKVGFGWALLQKSRWCTDYLKKNVMKKYLKDKYGSDYVEYIGIAFDEYKRYEKKNDARKIYPLIEWKITEGMALKYCYDKGFDWDGLYTYFDRVSCWCCPFKNERELRNLYNFFPELWTELKDMDNRAWNQFKRDYSVQDLENRFKKELENINLNL